MQVEIIPAESKELYDNCVKVIERVTVHTKQQLFPFGQALASLHTLYDRSAQVLEVTSLLEEVERERESMISSVVSGNQ